MDQSSWEAQAHSVPGQENFVRLAAGLIWLAMPLIFGTTYSAGYIQLLELGNNTRELGKVVECAYAHIGSKLIKVV